MKRTLTILLCGALLLAGCDTASNNSDYYSKDRNRTSDTDLLSYNEMRLVNVEIDSRDFSTTTVEISTCPKALAVGSNSCSVEVP